MRPKKLSTLRSWSLSLKLLLLRRGTNSLSTKLLVIRKALPYAWCVDVHAHSDFQGLAILALLILAVHSYILRRENRRRDAVEGDVSQSCSIY